MLQGLIIALLFSLGLSACQSRRDVVVECQQDKMTSEIGLGDNIFDAKEKLEKKGFSIKYGPDFPTKTKKYLMMIVDYGVKPNGLETFKYTVGTEGGAEPIAGIVRATPEGEITSIE